MDAKLQSTDNRSYPKFCLDLIEEIDEVYLDVIGHIARYYVVYPDGRIAVSSAELTVELRDLFRISRLIHSR